MQIRGGEVSVVPPLAETKKMKARRNSINGDKPVEKAELKPEKVKKGPKSVNGIDSLTLAISSIKLDNEPKKTVSVKVVKKAAVEEITSEKDELKPVNLENITESYVSSMKELLLSFEKSLQLEDSDDKKKSPSVPTSPMKKDNSLPLPRLLLTGGIPLPAAGKKEDEKVKKEEDEEKKAGPSSSTTPVVDAKEGSITPTRRIRQKSAPVLKEEAHIVRSSKQAQPRRRMMPGSFDGGYASPTGYTDLSGNLIPDATLDSLLDFSQQDFMGKTNNANSMDFYGFPDLNSATFNINFAGMGQTGEPAVYNAGEQGFTAESTPELVDCGEPGLGVYSSPAGPVTPPAAGTPYSTQNILASPYDTPPDLSQQTDNVGFNGGWSAPSSNIGSPPEQYMSPPAMTFQKLSPQTIHEMKRIILLPLSQEPSLLQFTPLIAAASQRLDEGLIFCLRDLEKFLLFKSQEMAPTPQTFVMFCEKFLSRCQHAIPYVEAAGGELTRPSDTPYYEGYFLDVLSQHREAMSPDSSSVQQVTILRRNPSVSSSGSVPVKKAVPVMGKVTKNSNMNVGGHANINAKMHNQILAALLDQASKEVDFYPTHVPTQLPLSPISDDHHSQDENQESGTSGQPRRKRMTVPKPLGGHVCMHRDEETGIICGKKYNRPCDLKKHGKTHSRPHKCSEPTCLYHEKGFPTEKERDRHETDRHTESPKMWHCEFPPCPYKSKRESNCKQHMEKQHDYVYERSKHNPRNPNGNAEAGKKKVEVTQQNFTLGSSVPVVKSSVLPTHKPNAPSIFETGMSTPPSDVYSNMFSVPTSMPESMYMTPSPESSHTYRSNSIMSVKNEPDVSSGDNWSQYGNWGQPVMGNNMMGFGMSAE